MSDPELIEYLIKKYGLTDLQSSFVVNNELKKISPVHLAKYMEEYEKLKEKITIVSKVSVWETNTSCASYFE